MAYKGFRFKENEYKKQIIKDGGTRTPEEHLQETKRLLKAEKNRFYRVEKAFGKRATKYWDKPANISDIVDRRGNIDMSKLSSAETEAYRFLKRSTSTVSGYRKQMQASIDTFNNLLSEDKENPVHIINEKNIFDLYDFLEDYRNKNNIQKIPDSDRVIDIFAESVKNEMSLEALQANMDAWDKQGLTNEEILEELRNMQNGDSSDEYEELY